MWRLRQCWREQQRGARADQRKNDEHESFAEATRGREVTQNMKPNIGSGMRSTRTPADKRREKNTIPSRVHDTLTDPVCGFGLSVHGCWLFSVFGSVVYSPTKE